MIQQSSQLEPSSSEGQQQPNRKLMLPKTFMKISQGFKGEGTQMTHGFPYSIAALEDFIAIGSSDGHVRLFDSSEQQICAIHDKKRVKSSPVTCLDFKRIGENKDIYIVSGHMEGQLAIYKVEGLLEMKEFLKR